MKIKDLRPCCRIDFCDIDAGTVFATENDVYMKLDANQWLVDMVDLKTGKLRFISPHEAVTPIWNAELVLKNLVYKCGDNDEESEGE